MIYHDKDTPKKATDRERYYWYKEHGICVQCRQNNVYSPRSKTLCLQCLEDQKERLKNRKISTEEQYRKNIHLRRYRELLKAFGVCPECAKRDVPEGHIYCDICLAKKRAKNKRKWRENGSLPRGLYLPTTCMICHKEKPDNGRKLCDECYDKSVKALKKAQQKQDNKNHYWRSDNKIAFHGRDNA